MLARFTRVARLTARVGALPARPRRLDAIGWLHPQTRVLSGASAAAAREAVRARHEEGEPAPLGADDERAPAAAAASSDGGEAFRREHEIDLDGQLDGVDLTPVATFAEVVALLGQTSRSLGKRAEATFKELGYSTPSVIQAQAWPIMLEGRDVIGVSKTGSGKTMGFMLPAVAKVIANKPALLKQKKFGPYVVVLAPTRELAQQITAEAEKLTKPNGLGIICTYGGESRGGQAMRVMRAARAKQFDVLVSTPGRLQDLIDDSTIVLDGTQLLVLDEADRMLDMGFEPQIRAIAESMPPPASRQTLLFSATWPREVKHLALDFTHEAIKVTIGSTDELSANRDITQTIHVITRGAARSKVDQLLRVLRPGADDGASADELEPPARGARGGSAAAVPQTLVFVNRKRTCDELEALLLDERIRCSALHGDLTQRRREGVIQQFKAKRLDVIVATDVAARGLDIKGLDMVVNYDFPLALEDYVHRIGRTGRAGRKGEAISFFAAGDAKLAPKLVELLRNHAQEVPAELEALAPRGWGGSDRGGRFDASRRPPPRAGRPGGFGGRPAGRGGARDFGAGDRGGGARDFGARDFERAPRREFGGSESAPKRESFGRGDFGRRDDFDSRERFPKRGARSDYGSAE